MGDREILITSKDKLKPKHKCEHKPYEFYRYEIANRDKDNQCCVAIYELPPGKANYPYHYHLNSEEVFYVISGSGLLETPQGNKEISAGDVIVCPPSEKGAHKIVNTSDTETLQYLDIDTIHGLDIAYYPHSDKVGVLVHGKSTKFYRNNDNVAYYEGE